MGDESLLYVATGACLALSVSCLWSRDWTTGLGLLIVALLLTVIRWRESRRENQEPPLTGPTILVVEDNPVLLPVIAEDVASLPAVVYRAQSLAEARGILRSKALDAAVIDLGLPDGSGLDLIRELRRGSFRQLTDPELPILILSGVANLRPHEVLAVSGADGFLPKPFPVSAAQEWVRKSLASRRSSRPSYVN